MNIKPVNSTLNRSASFGSAIVNINAFSDTHGELSLANFALEEMRNNQHDIFCKNKAGTADVIAVAGDWFMDGGKKGYATNPDKENAKFQLEMFNQLITHVKKISNNLITIFTPGNHEFDGGVQLLDEVLSDMNAEILMTNLDVNSSVGFKETINKNKLVNQRIVEVQDDKNPDLIHKVLFLGVSPVNLSAYQKKLDGVNLINNSPKVQRYVQKEDYIETLDDCKNRIVAFKEENPFGLVVLLSHTGVGFADNLAREAEVDLIFDGHEHKDRIRLVSGVPIVPLSQNFKKIINAKIMIDDYGELENISLKSLTPLDNKTKGPLFNFYRELFKKDLKKIYKVEADKDIESLDLKNLRLGNSYLANFVTDSVLEELQKKDASIDFFALNASSIRHPIQISKEKATISPFDVMNILSGIKREDGNIMTTVLKGKDIAYLVLDNFLFNKDAPQQNPLIYYSGLKINKTDMLKDYANGVSLVDLAKYIVDEKTGEPISLTKDYKIANVEKYFNKSQNVIIREFKHRSEYTGDVLQDLFKKHFEDSKGPLHAKCDERIY